MKRMEEQSLGGKGAEWRTELKQRRRFALLIISLATSFLLARQACAQSDADGFNPGANGPVRAIAVQADGKILVGGDFTTLGGGGTGQTPRSHIGRLNADGSLDFVFDPGADGTVDAIVVQSDGKLLVGGSFATLGGSVRNNIGRLNADGTPDFSFDSDANDFVLALALQSDGKVIVGGGFTLLNDLAHVSIGRLNADGTIDAGFNPGTDGLVMALATQSDDKILVGGSFSILGGVGQGTRNNIGRLNADGTLDLGFNSGANSSVLTIAPRADGKILVGGDFTTLDTSSGTVDRNFIGRLNSDGTADTAFDPGADSEVDVISLQSDAKILVGGSFASLGGSARNNIGRLNPSGSLDGSFVPGADGPVLALVEESPGEILVGGAFSTLGSGGSGTASRAAIGRLAPLVLPVFTSPLNVTATVGQQFVYQVLADNASSFDVVGLLPAGLSFDPAFEVITGIPVDAGTFDITLTATNEDGTTTATLTLNQQAAPLDEPVIISSTSATGRTDQPFRFQVITSGASPAARLSATNLPAGLNVDSITGEITGSATEDGSTAVILTVTDGNLTTTATLQLTFTSDPNVPVITSPIKATLVARQPFNYQVTAPTAEPNDNVAFDLLGPLPPGLGFDSGAGLITGTFPGLFRSQPGPLLSGGVVTNVELFAMNGSGTATSPLTFFVLPSGAQNISTRLAVGMDDNVLIGGFIITGNAPKKVLIRGIGPSLPVPGTLFDPTLDLHDKDGLLSSNDNWRDTQEQEIIDTTIPPTDNHESAIVAILSPLDPAVPGSGAYTVILGGKNNTTGIGLVEVYDLGTASFEIGSEAQLANISTRGKVQTGDNVMIGGFILGGSDASDVLLRAIGPELTDAGVPGALQDTILELHDVDGNLISSNDNWQSTQKGEIMATGVPPTDPRESAIVAILNPGNYTGIVLGKNNSTGVALVEVYVLP